MLIYTNKRTFLHKKRVQFKRGCLGIPTWPPFHCFGTSIWPPWCHVNTLYLECIEFEVSGYEGLEGEVLIPHFRSFFTTFPYLEPLLPLFRIPCRTPRQIPYQIRSKSLIPPRNLTFCRVPLFISIPGSPRTPFHMASVEIKPGVADYGFSRRKAYLATFVTSLR